MAGVTSEGHEQKAPTEKDRRFLRNLIDQGSVNGAIDSLARSPVTSAHIALLSTSGTATIILLIRDLG